MQLSPQTIEYLCKNWADYRGMTGPLITPFKQRTVHETGLSGGLSCAGYDVHMGEELVGLPFFDEKPQFNPITGVWILPARTGCLAVTVEKFMLPLATCMLYFNKSTLARQFLNACATLGEPGWEGHLTLELYNQSDAAFTLVPGQPIGQVIFNVLDEATAHPYRGKYQGQPQTPIQARSENHG